MTIDANTFCPTLGLNIHSSSNDPEEPEEPQEAETRTEEARAGVRLYIDPGLKFSSSCPNDELMFALVDGSAEGKEAREAAEAILKGWTPIPWKGMVWRGSVGQDRVWSGHAWEAPEATVSVDRPLTPELPSKVSVRLTEAIRDHLPSTITASELNKAYEASVKDPAGEEDAFCVTVLAFVQTRERIAQCRNLLMRNPEIAMDVEDIFLEFYADLLQRMKTQYKHDGRLDRWIAVMWGRYFFPKIKKEVIEYISKHRFVNNLDPEKAGYRFESHCVNTTNICSELTDQEKLSNVDRFIRELNEPGKPGKPASPLFELSAGFKTMLVRALQGETRQQAAARLDIHPRHALRLFEQAKTECRRLLGQDGLSEVLDDIQGCADEGDNVICISALKAFDLQAAADESAFEPLLGIPEAAKLLCVHPKTLQALARAGTVPCLRLGKYWRFRASALDVWVREGLNSDHQSRRVG